MTPPFAVASIEDAHSTMKEACGTVEMLIQALSGLLQGAFETAKNRALHCMPEALQPCIMTPSFDGFDGEDAHSAMKEA